MAIREASSSRQSTHNDASKLLAVRSLCVCPWKALRILIVVLQYFEWSLQIGKITRERALMDLVWLCFVDRRSAVLFTIAALRANTIALSINIIKLLLSRLIHLFAFVNGCSEKEALGSELAIKFIRILYLDRIVVMFRAPGLTLCQAVEAAPVGILGQLRLERRALKASERSWLKRSWLRFWQNFPRPSFLSIGSIDTQHKNVVELLVIMNGEGKPPATLEPQSPWIMSAEAFGIIQSYHLLVDQSLLAILWCDGCTGHTSALCQTQALSNAWRRVQQHFVSTRLDATRANQDSLFPADDTG
nr:hypothetical protein CFP56_11560 [Quercus suber]